MASSKIRSSTVIINNEEITFTFPKTTCHVDAINRRSLFNPNIFEQSRRDQGPAKANCLPILENFEYISENFGKSRSYKSDADDFEFDLNCDKFLRNIQLSPPEIELLERKTIGQSESDLWELERRKRLTASNFGRVFHMRKTTFRCSLVKTLLSLNPDDGFFNDAMDYGRKNEKNAIVAYQNRTNQTVTKCGLFVHSKFGCLAASPDGLVGDDGLIEVKCPYSAQFAPTVPAYLKSAPDHDVEDAKLETSGNDDSDYNNNYDLPIERDHIHQRLDLCESKLALNTRHNYYYQIQGQLEITNRKFCDFVVWTPRGIMHMERISRDRSVWIEMLPKLLIFYKQSLLPEIVNPRHVRGLPIREPDFVLEAIEKKQQVQK